jgi:hypothetical protein
MRSEVLPDVPTVGDFLPGYEASSWWGVSAQRNTPAAIIHKLNLNRCRGAWHFNRRLCERHAMRHAADRKRLDQHVIVFIVPYTAGVSSDCFFM